MSEQKDELKGAGDLIQKVLKKTGVAKVAKFVLGEDCGCDERRDKINKIWPFKNVKCLEEHEYKYLDEWFKLNKQTIKYEEQKKMLKIYNRTFNRKDGISQCAKCINNKVQELKKLYLNYKDK